MPNMARPLDTELLKLKISIGPDAALSKPEACALSGRSPASLDRDVRAGRLSRYKIGGRSVFLVGDVLAMAQRDTPSAPVSESLPAVTPSRGRPRKCARAGR
jgi:hypothetical protein